MKNYEEITQSVLRTAKIRKAAQKQRNRIVIAAAAACACSLALVLFAGIKHPAPPPVDATPDNSGAVVQVQPRIKLLTSKNEGIKQEMIQDVVTPLDLRMQVLDVRGMPEEEWMALAKEQFAAAKEMIQKSNLNNRLTQHAGPTAIITVISEGSFFIEIDDIDQVVDVSATCSSGGHVNKNRVQKPDGYSGIDFTWTPSQENITRVIEEDPAIKLSTFSDTVTSAVEFSDGSTETVTIDLIFNDDGQIYAVRRGTTVTT